jgi:hypothetical protein
MIKKEAELSSRLIGNSERRLLLPTRTSPRTRPFSLRRQYLRGPVHTNSVEGFNLRVRWPVSFITPTPSILTSIPRKRLCSARRIAKGEVIWGTRHEPPGRVCRRRSNCRRSSEPSSSERCAPLAGAALPSSPPLLSLGDKSVVFLCPNNALKRLELPA